MNGIRASSFKGFMVDRVIVEEIRDFHVRKNITELFKSFLVILEDLEQDHLMYVEKLKKCLPSEHHPVIDNADYLDESKVEYLRKKILDLGNNCIRNMGK